LKSDSASHPSRANKRAARAERPAVIELITCKVLKINKKGVLIIW
jgi:hypothetical protein